MKRTKMYTIAFKFVFSSIIMPCENIKKKLELAYDLNEKQLLG